MEKSGSSSTLIITLPDKLWLGKLSRKYSMSHFQIISFMPINQEPAVGNSLIKISTAGRDLDNILDEIQNHPSLVSIQIMEKKYDQMTIETQTNDQFLLRSLIKNRILVKPPVEIDSGDAIFNIIAQRENINKFIEDLSEKGLIVHIKNLGYYTEDFLKINLTERQLFIFKKAKETGYYDTPRKINLTKLAYLIGIAKSSLSSILQRIHKKLLGGS